MQDVRKIANKKEIEVGKLDKLQLIRSIQKTEGNSECFATCYVSACRQAICLWREDCLTHFNKVFRL
jgi:hypothetical protein